MNQIVTCEKEKSQVLFILNNNFSKNYSGFYFPFQEYETLQRNYINNIKNIKNNKNFSITTRDIQSRRAVYLLYKNEKNENVQYIIFKNQDVIKTNFLIKNDKYFDTSIFDISYLNGEITIFDSIIVSGIKIHAMNYIERFNNIEQFLKETQGIYKPIFYESVKDIDCKNLKVLFISKISVSKVPGINSFSYEWIPEYLIDFNFQTEENDDKIELYTTCFRKKMLFATLSGELIENIKSLNDYSDNSIVTFNFDNDTIKVKNINKDVTCPCSIKNIEKFLMIKKENILKEELY